MIVAHVHVHVKPECVQDFIEATIENASNSLQEHGIARFDVTQQKDDPTRFVLSEVYYTEDDPAKHKETSHYQAWKAAVEPMMAEPRASVKMDSVFPYDDGWKVQ